MKILLYHWKAYSNAILADNLKRLGHEVTIWSHDGVLHKDAQAIEELVRKLGEGYELVFSYNYFGGAAHACHQQGIPYVSWTQDSPMLGLYDDASVFDTNYFFCFDSEQFIHMSERGLPHVYYLPLAVDMQRCMSVADQTSDGERERFSSEVSFVGSLYAERTILGDIWDGLSKYVQGYLDAFMETQLQVPALRFSQMNIDGQCMRLLKEQLKFLDEGDYVLTFTELMDNLLDRHVTVRERIRMLEVCRDYAGFRLFTNSEAVPVEGIANCGGVDYSTELPKVFRHSKINLNVTLRSIRRGIPLRILDIIASGGFCLTNAQPDLELWFEEGKSIVTFRNMEDMRRKIHYYLRHEEERKKIIEAGQEVIRNHFDYSVQLPKIFGELQL